MYRLRLCLLFACACAQTESIESIIAQLFNTTEQQGTTLATVTTSSTPKPHQAKRYESCTTSQNERGLCVLYFLCNENGYIITNGNGIFDIRERRRRRRSPAEGGDERPTEGSQQTASGSLPPANDVNDVDFEEWRPLNFVRDRPCKSYLETCCRHTRKPQRPTITTPAPQSQKPACGRRQPDGVGFYYTGPVTDEAKFAEFPWMVAVARNSSVDDALYDKNLITYVGGGSLIHPSVVLTAAHFSFQKSTFRVRAGSISLRSNNYENVLYPHQDRDVEEMKRHEEYDKASLTYDIALLFLVSPMTMTPNVGVVCLPSQSDYLSANTGCFASGWGKDKFGKKGKYQTRLKKLDLTIIDHYTCQEQLQQTRLGVFFELHSSFTCASGEPGKDTCRGDGGSPLVCPIAGDQNRYEQRGIVSWGIGCGNDGIPGVYTDVAKARPWIDSVSAAKGFDMKAYAP